MAEPDLNLPRHHNAYTVSVSLLKGKNKRWHRAPKVARERASRAFQVPGFECVVRRLSSVVSCQGSVLSGLLSALSPQSSVLSTQSSLPAVSGSVVSCQLPAVALFVQGV